MSKLSKTQGDEFYPIATVLDATNEPTDVFQSIHFNQVDGPLIEIRRNNNPPPSLFKPNQHDLPATQEVERIDQGWKGRFNFDPPAEPLADQHFDESLILIKLEEVDKKATEIQQHNLRNI